MLWARCRDTIRNTHKKPSNIAELKTALLSIWNDLPQEFIDGDLVIYKETWIDVAAAGGHFKHSVSTPRWQLTFITEKFELLSKKLCKV